MPSWPCYSARNMGLLAYGQYFAFSRAVKMNLVDILLCYYINILYILLLSYKVLCNKFTKFRASYLVKVFH